MIYKLELERLKANTGFLAAYTQGIAALLQSGVFSFLRGFTSPNLIDNGANPNVMAAQAAFAAGYNKALDDLYYFRELYLDEPSKHPETLQPTFGALDLAKKQGFITEEEIDAIRRNEPPKYNTVKYPKPNTGV